VTRQRRGSGRGSGRRPRASGHRAPLQFTTCTEWNSAAGGPGG